MTGLRRRTAWALALQGLALALLLAALAGVSALDPRGRPRWLVLVDRSQSMPRGDTDAAVAEITAALGAVQVDRVAFAGQPAAAGEPAPDTGRTNLEAALQAALARHAQTPLAGVAVVSDAHATDGDAARALRALRDAGLPVHWRALGRPPPPARLGAVLAPPRARSGGAFGLRVGVQGEGPVAWRVRGRARAAGGATQEVVADVQGGAATLDFDAFRGGAVVVDLVLEDIASGTVLDRRSDAAVVEVAGAARLLVAQGSPGIFARSLAAGGWPVRSVPASRLDAEAGTLEGVDAVVLDNVAATDASPRFWQALERAVRERGIGLVVLGGERAYARGGYRGSPLEALLPLHAEPAADDERAAVVFAVDKSGSMGLGSGGVDRFAMAQRAVVETARGLGPRDLLGLLAFDIEPRVLLPVGPAAAGLASVERDWPVQPAGGTKLAPALEAALGELERTPAARRLLVLVTDGFTEAAALPALRARLALSRIEAVALAVGPDADVPALQRLFGEAPGTVLRVAEAAELPQVMKRGLERRRARVERGDLAVQQVAPLPFAPGRFANWPAVAAYAATRAQPGATVVLQSARGDALLATWPLGRGRVAALATGLGAWSPRWAAWSEWPRWAGGLASWAAGSAEGPWALSVVGEGPSMAIELEGEPAPGLTLAIDTPAAPGPVAVPQALVPGRLRALLPEAGPGLYTVRLGTPQGPRSWPVLRRAPDEAAQFGVAAELDGWRKAGWVQPWDAQQSPRTPPPHGGRPPPDRTLLALALLLSLAGVVVERASAFSGRWRLAWPRR